jgi:hypothetical protein
MNRLRWAQAQDMNRFQWEQDNRLGQRQAIHMNQPQRVMTDHSSTMRIQELEARLCDLEMQLRMAEIRNKATETRLATLGKLVYDLLAKTKANAT